MISSGILSLLLFVLALFQTVVCLPRLDADGFVPDSLIALTPDSKIGEYFLRLQRPAGGVPTSAFVTADGKLAPEFFVRSGELYAMTNETHLLRAHVMNNTQTLPPDALEAAPYLLEFRTVPSNIRWGRKAQVPFNGKTAPEVGTMWAWGGTTLVYSVPLFPRPLTRFFACHTGVYLALDSELPIGCTAFSLHTRDAFASMFR